MSELWALAAAAAVGVAWWRPGAWETWIAAAVGLLVRNPGVALGGMLAGLAVTSYRAREAAQWAADRRDARTDQLLQQVEAVARPGIALTRILDQVGIQRRVPGLSGVETLGRLYPTPALVRALPAWEAVERFGGSLAEVVRYTRSQVEQDRRIRWDRSAALAGARLTLLMVSLAPWGILLLFEAILPSFAASLTNTLVGLGLLVWCGASAWILQVLGAYGEEG